MGFVVTELRNTRTGHMESKAVPCDCQSEARARRRTQFLTKMDGLTPGERLLRFATIDDNYEPGVMHGLKLAAEQHRGLITLTGGFGVGKTTLLMCAVNEARDNNQLAIYTTVTDLLSYLRSTFDPDADESFDKYWDALIRCAVLALDEMDEFRTTPWAMERFLRLIDERWRRMDEVLTLCALNGRINSLPGKVQSRLQDGRGQVIAIGGTDLRPMKSWG